MRRPTSDLVILSHADLAARRLRRRAHRRRPQADQDGQGVSDRRRRARARSMSIAAASWASPGRSTSAIVGRCDGAARLPTPIMRLEGPPGPVEVDCKVGDNDRPAARCRSSDGQHALCRGLDEGRPDGRRAARSPKSRPIQGRGSGTIVAPRRAALTDVPWPTPSADKRAVGSPLNITRPTAS